MISNIQAAPLFFIPASDHFNVCNDQRNAPTILLSQFAYSYDRISGGDTMHKTLLVFFFFFFSLKSSIETLLYELFCNVMLSCIQIHRIG